jgi:hypothetical protein
MARLILTATDSGAGCLMRAGIADIVIPLGFRFVWGALPSAADLEVMVGPGSLNHFPERWPGEFHSKGMGLLDLCERCETIELWIDPNPNSQLVLVWLLDYLRSHAKIVPKLTLIQADAVIGGHLPEAVATWRLPAIKIENEHLVAASKAWQAYRQPTPRDWFDLLGKDIGALPLLRPIVLELLEELPSRSTGLGATEMRMLELVSAGNVSPFDVFPGHGRNNTRRVFEYWETGSLLDGLAHGPAPAVSGLDEGPFTEDLHDDADRHARYTQSKLSLTAFGKAVLAQSEDFSRHNPIRRWWGGTELTNDRLWRWDPERSTLIAP